MVCAGESPQELVVAQDKQVAIVANYGNQQAGNTISIVELGAIQKPHDLNILRNAVYFTAERSRLNGRLNLTNYQVDWFQSTGQNGTHLLRLNPDGKTVYTTNRLSN
ncbi:hypothetical protein [Flavihumibacter sp. UBA7668]|uniref:hypothetical protein n=1 Tax=Flavihumibacter sp. UBA7668 TaxID=1946542 RepID=UPI0025BF0F16|nr:hypothetical protein [Flavihumibacter sp. UBA7668]